MAFGSDGPLYDLIFLLNQGKSLGDALADVTVQYGPSDPIVVELQQAPKALENIQLNVEKGLTAEAARDNLISVYGQNAAQAAYEAYVLLPGSQRNPATPPAPPVPPAAPKSNQSVMVLLAFVGLLLFTRKPHTP